MYLYIELFCVYRTARNRLDIFYFQGYPGELVIN